MSDQTLPPAPDAADIEHKTETDSWYESLALPFYVPPEYRAMLVPIDTLYEDPSNLNIHDAKNLDAIEGSLRDFGFMDAIKAAEDGRVVVGNGRLRVAKRMGASHVPKVTPLHLSDLDQLRYAISDNRTSDLSYFDEPALAAVLGAFDPDVLPPGFDRLDIDAILAAHPLPGGSTSEPERDIEKIKQTLFDLFGVPPFSVLDARQGYWQARKKIWLSLGIKSEVGRGEVLLYGVAPIIAPNMNPYRGSQDPKADRRAEAEARAAIRDKSGRVERNEDGSLVVTKTDNGLLYGNQKGLNAILRQSQAQQAEVRSGKRPGEKSTGKKPNTGGLLNQKHIHAYDGSEGGDASMCGTSIFDPVLCEMAYRWFAFPGATVIDPFAGGSVRGIIASTLGLSYQGIDLRAEQIAANQQQRQDIDERLRVALPDADRPPPIWHCGDALDMDILVPMPQQFDFLFTCPPYGDLEVYSDDPRDISNKGYTEFKETYREIIARGTARLKDDRFAMIVVGDFRNKKGFYCNFVSDTIEAFLDAGLELYNDMVLVTVAGSLPIRAQRYMERARKIGKSHQNVLVFVKGDPKAATAACGTVNFDQMLTEEQKAEAMNPAEEAPDDDAFGYEGEDMEDELEEDFDDA